MDDLQELLSVGAMLRHLRDVEGIARLDYFKIRYAISRCGVKPVARAGNIPVYAPEHLDAIRSELLSIAAKHAAAQNANAVGNGDEIR